MPIENEATITAIATPPGQGGIGIIRISGQEALPILKRVFKPKSATSFQSHRMLYGWIVHPTENTILDEVLAVFMQGPRTYTREDVVEIHCHGSYLLLQSILELIIEQGAILADPGEFTKRAFLGGRIDLTQAEAVLDILQAKTREGLRLAMSQLQGQLFKKVTELRDVLLSVLAVVEVAIDFPDEDVEILHAEDLKKRLAAQVKEPLEELIDISDKGKIYQEGISAVILGRPNVGKSSLLNSLLKEDRAIVTAVPGTTRDTIEEYLDIKGIPIRIIDTAGIRKAQGAVEEIGIERSKQKLENADLVLLMVDASESLTDEDNKLFEYAQKKKILVVVNKIDKVDKVDQQCFSTAFPNVAIVTVSAKENQGIKALENAIFDLVVVGSGLESGNDCVPNIRHKAALKKALKATESAIKGLDTVSPDLLAIEMQAAISYLGDIIGTSDVEDVLDTIFERFCIGK